MVFIVALLQAVVLIPGQAGGAVCDGRPVLGSDENEVECDTYCRLLRQAADLGAANAQLIPRPAYREIYAEPDRFRGQLIAVQGTLKRLTVYDAPDFLRNRTGLKTLYEAWIAVPPTGEPLCVLLTHWPDGVSHAGRLDVPVEAAGYFFKRYRYDAPDGWRDAPLLMGGPISPRIAECTTWLGPRAALPSAAAAIALMLLGLWLWVDDRSFGRLSHGVKVRG